MKLKNKIISLLLSLGLLITNVSDVNAMKFVGIRNLGVSCFVNAALQQLYHTNLFKESIMTVEVTEPARQATIVALKGIFRKMDQCADKGSIDIRNEIRSLKVYQGHADDAQGVVTLLINRCDMEYKQEKNKFSKIFEVQHIDKIFCTSCDKNVLEREENYGEMICLTPAPTLDTMMSNYCLKDDLEGYVCEQCHQPEKCYLVQNFKASGDVLMINLGRIKRKGKTRIQFEEEYNFGSDNKYRLKGIIMYTGGHYYSYVRDTEKNCWYNLNDSSVSLVGSFDNIKETCYGNDKSAISATSLYYEKVV